MYYASPIRRLPLYLALALLTQCSKCKQDPTPAKPEDQLPPATQTGAGTFGCLLNGQPWVPSGNLTTPNFFVLYDPTYHGGNLDIRTYRFTNSSKNRQYFSFGSDGVDKEGIYPFSKAEMAISTTPNNVAYSDDSKNTPCNYYNYAPGTSITGRLTVTRLDKTQGIVSGTFNFTLAQLGCDTLKFTNGRFDYKL